MAPHKAALVRTFVVVPRDARWEEFEYRREPNPDKREAMKDVLMGGRNACVRADHYDRTPINISTTIGHLSYEEACPLLLTLDRALRVGRSRLVVQVGSSSGREITDLAGRHPQHQFVGTDIYDEAVDYGRRQHRLANLSFHKCSARDLVEFLAPHCEEDAIVFSSGSLQYVQPEHLNSMFRSLASFVSDVLVHEPASEALGSPLDIRGSRWLGNVSYAHNYREYGEQAGVTTTECRIIRPYAPYDAFPHHPNTVHFFYWGSRAAKAQESPEARSHA